MLHRWKHKFGSAACAVLFPVVVSAQGLEIVPLDLDVAEEGALVRTAFVAQDAAPVFGTPLIETAGIVPVAVRTAANLPQPSIILGTIEAGQEAEFGIETLLPATVTQVAFALDDLDARAAMRANDPDLFRQLIEEGHLDPEPDQLNRVLQVELQRMNCYRSGIDGAWGPGSRRSVASYFDQLTSVSWPDQNPSNDLFRAIMINGDVACPTPVAAPRATTPRRTTTSTTTTRRATTTPRPAPTPAPAAPAVKPQISIGGSGVFR
ncbi:hypothetical protein [Tateyamaria sp. ANG-S1]|uniref:hypothetical protein n=1 Tax=Tateyamaria sp. ANG-S1 TaxID=1577905 RepID=UPI000691BCDE|nr:hypothetical protein [Tateyamaria sp. ANG-S1]